MVEEWSPKPLAGRSSLSTRANSRFMSKMISYLKEAFSELLNKVTWPSWDDLQNSSIVVAIATLIIALVIYLLDTTFSNLLDLYYSFFA